MTVQMPKIFRDTAINFGAISFVSLALVKGMEFSTGRHQHKLLPNVWGAVAAIFAAQPFLTGRAINLSAILASCVVYAGSVYTLNSMAHHHGRAMVHGIIGTTMVIGVVFAFFTKENQSRVR